MYRDGDIKTKTTTTTCDNSDGDDSEGRDRVWEVVPPLPAHRCILVISTLANTDLGHLSLRTRRVVYWTTDDNEDHDDDDDNGGSGIAPAHPGAFETRPGCAEHLGLPCVGGGHVHSRCGSPTRGKMEVLDVGTVAPWARTCTTPPTRRKPAMTLGYPWPTCG